MGVSPPFEFAPPFEFEPASLDALRAAYEQVTQAYEQIMQVTWVRLFETEQTAEDKALRFLREWLSSAQVLELERHGYFTARGSRTGTSYRIFAEHQNFNVKGPNRRTYCFVPAGNLPWGDVLLAQKLTIETDEDEMLAVANIHQVNDAGRVERAWQGGREIDIRPCSCPLCCGAARGGGGGGGAVSFVVYDDLIEVVGAGHGGGGSGVVIIDQVAAPDRATGPA